MKNLESPHFKSLFLQNQNTSKKFFNGPCTFFLVCAVGSYFLFLVWHILTLFVLPHISKEWAWNSLSFHRLDGTRGKKRRFVETEIIQSETANRGALAASCLGFLSQKGWWNAGHVLQLWRYVEMQGIQAALQKTTFMVLEYLPPHTHLVLNKAW